MKIKCSKYVKEHVTKELMQQLVLLHYQIPCKKAHAFRFEQTKTHTRIHHLVEDTMLTTELKKMDVPSESIILYKQPDAILLFTKKEYNAIREQK